MRLFNHSKMAIFLLLWTFVQDSKAIVSEGAQLLGVFGRFEYHCRLLRIHLKCYHHHLET